jgi:16S rRNA (uracil1498-N3)-methyltransferase
MDRFFVDPSAIRGESIELGGAQARQVASVLRLHPGDEITLLADGREHIVTLATVSASRVTGRVREARAASGEPRVAIALGLPLLRGDHSEEIVEAVTQLGVSRIAPFVSARSVARVLPEPKRRRWERIAREAAETARRGRVPEIEPLRRWDELLVALRPPLLVAWERETLMRVRYAVPANVASLAVLVGPEGGLTEDEIVQARKRGAVTVSLGARNLRSETAAVALVSLIADALG